MDKYEVIDTLQELYEMIERTLDLKEIAGQKQWVDKAQKQLEALDVAIKLLR